MTIRGFPNSSSVPPLPSFSERDSRSSREPGEPPDPRSLDWCTAGLAARFGAVKFLSHHLAIPGEKGIGSGDTRDLLQAFASYALADFRPLAIGEPPAWLQTRLQNAVLGRQVLILEQELLVDQTGHVGQKPRACGCVRPQRPS